MDNTEAQLRSRGYLPHWQRRNAVYFVTFRLADSLPDHLLPTAVTEANSRIASRAESALDRARRVQKILDSGRGSCVLARIDVAEIVATALRHFDGSRYRLLCWCVMPNHVHVVVQPAPSTNLSSVVHSWKSYTAQQINRLLGRQGTLWQREYYDHIVRSEVALGRIMVYVMNNPAKAGLVNWPWVQKYPDRFGDL